MSNYDNIAWLPLCAGLTGLGADVIRECNRLGIVIDHDSRDNIFTPNCGSQAATFLATSSASSLARP